MRKQKKATTKKPNNCEIAKSNILSTEEEAQVVE